MERVLCRSIEARIHMIIIVRKGRTFWQERSCLQKGSVWMRSASELLRLPDVTGFG